MTITDEDLLGLIETQLASWPLAADNYAALKNVRSRKMDIGDFHIRLQCNPARAKSTCAKIDSASIKKRPCFLCASNRPAEQLSAEIIPGWELLVNPYPIFPVHFTIAATQHIPQAQMPLEMATLAEMMPSTAIFFNGAKAGASAPDHMHCQAVLKSELPIIGIAEACHPSAKGGFMDSTEFGLELPFRFVSAVVTPDLNGMETLARIPEITGHPGDSETPDHGLKNVFFWIGPDSLLRAIVIPRKAHRPKCYNLPEPDCRMVSPGAIDMAGIIILPRVEDFEQLTEEEVNDIYSQTAFRQ